MKTVTVQSRVNQELKSKAENVFSQMGMSTADAIRMFLQQTVNDGGLPFQPHTKTPNIETLTAFSEVEDNQTTQISSNDLRDEMGL